MHATKQIATGLVLVLGLAGNLGALADVAGSSQAALNNDSAAAARELTQARREADELAEDELVAEVEDELMEEADDELMEDELMEEAAGELVEGELMEEVAGELVEEAVVELVE